MGKVHNKLAVIEEKLGDSGLYEVARKDELRELLAEQARLKGIEAELEEAWLLALETLEELQRQLEEAD
jgi:ATP-binding cassette subfamily F protein 3